MTPLQAVAKLKESPLGFTHAGLYIEKNDDGTPIVTDEGVIVFVVSGEVGDEVTAATYWMDENFEKVEVPDAIA